MNITFQFLLARTMRRIFLALALSSSSSFSIAEANIVLLGNMPQLSDSLPSVNLNPSRLKAQLFTLGNQDFFPTTVHLRIGQFQGSLASFATPIVEIRDASNSIIGDTLASFELVSTLVSGIQTETFAVADPSFRLMANSRYALVVSSNAPTSNTNTSFSYVSWYASQPGVLPTGTATWNGQAFSNGAGFGSSNTGLSSFQIEGVAAPIPEPSTAFLLVFGFLTIGVLRNKLGRPT